MLVCLLHIYIFDNSKYYNSYLKISKCFTYDCDFSNNIVNYLTLTDDEKEWFNVGEYKKRKNFVGSITTTLPSDVEIEMKDLFNWYDSLDNKKIEDIIEFHVKFERIHPFQDGNGRVGRMIMFRECLFNNIMPFYIEDRNKDFYIRDIREYQLNDDKQYLIDTCLNSQDNYEKMVNYFLSTDD